MSFEIIDNTFQVIVLAAMALLAFILAFRRSSRSCLILAFGYASFMMGTLYYLLHLIILGHGPQVFYVAECSWMASYFFFLSLEILYWEGLRPPFSLEMSLQILLFVASGFIRDYTRFSLYSAVDILLTLTLVSFLPHILREEPHDLH